MLALGFVIGMVLGAVMGWLFASAFIVARGER